MKRLLSRTTQLAGKLVTFGEEPLRRRRNLENKSVNDQVRLLFACLFVTLESIEEGQRHAPYPFDKDFR